MKSIIISAVLALAFASDNIDYSKQDEWKPDDLCQDGEKQSPIDIPAMDSESDVESVTLKKAAISLPGACGAAKLTNKNDPNTIKMATESDIKYTVVNKAVDAELKQLHLHWGKEDGKGSEHLFKGKQYDAELHLVTQISESQFAVLGRFFSAKDGVENEQIKALIDAQSAPENDAKRNIAKFNITALFSDVKTVATYDGSLTTPECNEFVYWQVVVDPVSIPIGKDQLKTLRELKLGANKDTDVAKKFNWRKTQERHNRTVTFVHSNAIGYSLSLVLVLTTILQAFM